MGLFEKIFPKSSDKYVGSSYWQTLTAYSPVFQSRAGGAYESELVRAAIDARARHNSKLNIVVDGSAKKITTSRLKKQPNEFQTWSQFLYRTSTILDMQNTAFIVPIFGDYGEVVGIYTLLPSSCAIVDVNGAPWLKYKFFNNKTAAVRLDECGILTRFQYKNDFFGEAPALGTALDMLDLQNKGIKEAIKNGASVRFMAQLANFTKAEDLKKERDEFNKNNLSSEFKGNRLDLFPNTYKDIRQVTPSPYVIDSAQLDMIRANVFAYFGVNENVLQNKASNTELDAFFNGAIEPFAIQLSEVLTKMIFTEREKSEGNALIVAANRLQYMSTSEKVALVQQLGDRGMILIDEARELFNYPPLPDGIGQNVPIRGEYYMVGEEKEKEGETNATE